jgi:hypothetical protein
MKTHLTRFEGFVGEAAGNGLVPNEQAPGGMLLQGDPDCGKIKAHWKKRNSWSLLFGIPAKERGFTARPAFLAGAQRKQVNETRTSVPKSRWQNLATTDSSVCG